VVLFWKIKFFGFVSKVPWIEKREKKVVNHSKYDKPTCLLLRSVSNLQWVWGIWISFTWLCWFVALLQKILLTLKGIKSDSKIIFSLCLVSTPDTLCYRNSDAHKNSPAWSSFIILQKKVAWRSLNKKQADFWPHKPHQKSRKLEAIQITRNIFWTDFRSPPSLWHVVILFRNPSPWIFLFYKKWLSKAFCG